MTDEKKTVGDALADFTSELARYAGHGGGYQDGPFAIAGSGYADWYRRSWLARAAVDALPDECFKRGYQWVAEDDQISLIEGTERRLGVKGKIRQALSLSRLHGTAYIYMDDGSDPTKEFLPSSVHRDGLRFINVLRHGDVYCGDVVKDPLSPWFGQPEYYRVNEVPIHPSRMIRFANNPDHETGQGRSVLEYMLEPILAASTARDNVVALTTEANIDIISVCGFFDAVADPVEARRVAGRYEQMRQGKATNKLAVLDKDNEEWSQRQVSFGTLPDVIEAMRREVSAAIGIPYSILFGRPGGLGANAETELKVWYDSVVAMQSNYIDSVCSPLFLAIERSALGFDKQEIHHVWLSLTELSDKEKAEVAKTLSDAAGLAVDKDIIPPEVMTAPLVNAWTELGVFQGLEQEYNNWIAGGSPDDDDDDMVAT